MKIRTGLITLCALVAVTFTSCSFFQGRKNLDYAHQPLFLQNPCPPVNNPFFQNMRNYSSFNISPSQPPKKEKEETLEEIVEPKKKDPLEPITLLELRDLLVAKKGSEAAAHARSMLEKDPKDLIARYALALAYDIMDRKEDAIREADKVLQADPEFDYVPIYFTAISRHIFETIFKEKCYEKGLRTYRHLLSLVESNGARTVFESWISSVNFKAGRELYKEEKFEEAQKYLQAAARENPSNFDICRKLGICSIHTMKFSMAASVFEKLEREDINEADKAFMFYTQAMSSRKKKRATLLEQAHRAWPEYELEILEDCFSELARHYVKQKEKEKLLPLFEIYPRNLEFPSNKKAIAFHVALFDNSYGFFLDGIKDKEIGAVYFGVMYAHFKKEGKIAKASRCLYGKFSYDNDEKSFRQEYASLGDHLITADKAMVVLKRFFSDKKE